MNPSEIIIPIKIIFSENLNEELNNGLSCFVGKPFNQDNQEEFKKKAREILDRNMSFEINGKLYGFQEEQNMKETIENLITKSLTLIDTYIGYGRIDEANDYTKLVKQLSDVLAVLEPLI